FQDAFGLLFKRRVDEKLSGLGIKWRQTRDEDHIAGASAGRDRHTPFLEIAVKRFDADNLPLHDLSPCTIWLFPSTSMPRRPQHSSAVAAGKRSIAPREVIAPLLRQAGCSGLNEEA